MSDREQVVLNGRYELHRRVGRGGMAEVYLARDRLLDRLVAIKILFPEFATDPSFVARFRREAQAAANLNHPNIVGVYDWGKERGTYYIVMEYVDGRPVSDMIRSDGPLEPKKAAAIAADVAGALGFAHRKGVVHRDVKPGNVLITKSGEVKVADFGIARAMTSSGEEELTQTGSVMGTATYFSPEQAQGKPVDARTDLYSLGVVLYEMVAGKPPFSGDSPVAIAYQHVQEPIPPLAERAPGVPEPYEAIVMRALAKDADARYPDGAAMRADLLRFRDGRPIAAGPVAAAAAGGAIAGAAAAAGVGATAAVPAAAGPVATGAAPAATGAADAVAPPNKRTGWFFVVIIIFLVLLGGLLVVFGNQLGIFDQQTKSVTMPRVVDKPIGEATEELEALELVVETADRESEEPEGTVLEQSPAPGDQVEEGSTVILTVSIGIGTATVPPVTGLPLEQAMTVLEEAGFTDVDDQEEESEDVNLEGFVLRSSPVQGSVVPKNTPITLFVAIAAAPTTTVAPTTTSPPTTAAPTTTSPPATTTTSSTTTTTTSTTTTSTTTSTTVAP